MILRRLCRPFLRLYFRNPRLAIGTIILFVILTLVYPSAIISPLQYLKDIFSSSNTEPEYNSNDIFIPSDEFKFEMKESSSQSLFGNAQCLLLDIDYRSESIMKYQKDLGELKCSGQSVSFLGGGVLHVKGKGLQDVSYQAIQTAKTAEDKGFILGDRMSVVTAQVQLTPGTSMFSL